MLLVFHVLGKELELGDGFIAWILGVCEKMMMVKRGSCVLENLMFSFALNWGFVGDEVDEVVGHGDDEGIDEVLSDSPFKGVYVVDDVVDEIERDSGSRGEWPRRGLVHWEISAHEKLLSELSFSKRYPFDM